jgi:branched-chain amino acid transport system permease protein
MMGAFVAWMLLHYLGIGYWWALLLAPLDRRHHRRRHRAAADLAALPPRPSLRPAADLRPRADHPGLFRNDYGSRACPTDPRPAAGGQNLGFMFLPNYRAWVVVARSSSASAPGS